MATEARVTRPEGINTEVGEWSTLRYGTSELVVLQTKSCQTCELLGKPGRNATCELIVG